MSGTHGTPVLRNILITFWGTCNPRFSCFSEAGQTLDMHGGIHVARPPLLCRVPGEIKRSRDQEEGGGAGPSS